MLTAILLNVAVMAALGLLVALLWRFFARPE